MYFQLEAVLKTNSYLENNKQRAYYSRCKKQARKGRGTRQLKDGIPGT
jgi:hypothetical protein